MFFAEDRLKIVVKMILSAVRGQKGLDLTRDLKARISESKGRAASELRKDLAKVQKEYGKYIADYTSALKALLPMQRKDFAVCSARCTATRSPFGPSIRRCTSSCPSEKS